MYMCHETGKLNAFEEEVKGQSLKKEKKKKKI
jgi:hypothetical protein